MDYKYLKTILTYNENTGVFTWAKHMSNKAKVGGIAGSVGFNGYIYINHQQTMYLAHRLAWLFTHEEIPEYYIDHINHDKTDNRICNLRSVTPSESMKNRPLQKNNTSGHVGVHKAKGKWAARIKVSGKEYSLGTYNEFEEAVKAREAGELKYGFHKNNGKGLK